MKRYNFIVRNLSKVVAILGGLFLLTTMVLTVTNVITRGFGSTIAGVYELTNVFIIVVAASALGYTAYHGSHVVVDVIVSHFSERIRGITDSIVSFLGLSLWGLVIWRSTLLLYNRWGLEETELLDVSYIPFRIIWVFGLVFMSLVLISDIVNGIRKASSK